jgi:cytochrome c oxidase cbb3-type subunit I/II
LASEEVHVPARERHEEKPGLFNHRWLEGKPAQFTMATLVLILIGGLVEIVPVFLIGSNTPTIASVKPYTPLELQGRDIYVREGCNTCHSQMIRPFRSETERYGEYSKAGEYVYDHPHLWGSKRTGPDLMRVGGKYPDGWHYNHMRDPTSMSPGSLMPAFPWLITDKLDAGSTPAKIRAMQTLGVPYPPGYDQQATADLEAQAAKVTANLKESNIDCQSDREIIALIAYLQRMGTDIKTGTGAQSGQ